MKIASTKRAGSLYKSVAPKSFHAWNSSNSAMLSDVMYDVGQLVTDTLFRAQTTTGGVDAVPSIHPHRRFLSKPLFRHPSHFHAAWLAN